MKTIFSAILSIALVSVLLGAGTYAYFGDTETSTGNMFAAGTLDSKTSDNGVTYTDGVSENWVMGNMEPGVSVFLNTITLANKGIVEGQHMEISFSHFIDDNEGGQLESDTVKTSSVPADLAKWIEVTTFTYDHSYLVTYDSSGYIGSIIDANANGWIDLQDLTMAENTVVGGPLDNLNPPMIGGVETMTMGLYFRPEATNDIQGDTLTTTVTFTLNQHSSQ